MPEKTGPVAVGRPGKFKPEYVEQARKLTQLGATDREVAEFFNVSEQTLNAWKHVHPEFLESLKLGKDTADRRVEQSLYRRAVGYSYDAVKIMGYEGEYTHVPYVAHLPPDTTACIFWLKNRQRDEWRDRVDVEKKVVREITTYTDDELRDIIRRGRSNGSGNGVAEPKEVSAMLSTPRAPAETTMVPAANPPANTSTRSSRG